MASGPAEEKELATGLHRVRDIYCKMCLTIVGWTYVSYTFNYFGWNDEILTEIDVYLGYRL